jgi:3',5'-cyclic-AMP phosphodiesterase
MMRQVGYLLWYDTILWKMCRSPMVRRHARYRGGVLLARTILLSLLATLLSAGCGSKRAGTAGGSSLPPADQEFRPFVFLHASDTHIGGMGDLAQSRDRLIRLARQANELKPDFVLATGDLVNDGDAPAQWATLEEALREFRMPVKLLPGNHDDLAAFRARFGPGYYRFTYRNCDFLCLDSTALRRATTQWVWLEHELLESRRWGRRHVFIAMHEPPQDLPVRDDLERLIRDYGVKVVLAGHLHRTVELAGDGYTTYVVSGNSYPRDQSGLCYRLFRVGEDGITQRVVRSEAGPESAPQETSGPAGSPDATTRPARRSGETGRSPTPVPTGTAG